MPPTDLERFDESLSRCYANPGFLERFYQLFLEASPEARAKFAGTDMAQQRRMLKASLMLMMLAGGAGTGSMGHMAHIGAVHGKGGHDIPAPLYDIWLDCLLQAVREIDPRVDDTLLAVWRRVLEPGIAYMKSHYDAPPARH